LIRKKLELNGKSPLRYGWQKRISCSDRIGVTTSELPIDHLTLRILPPRPSGPDAWSLSNLRTPANGWLLRNQQTVSAPILRIAGRNRQKSPARPAKYFRFRETGAGDTARKSAAWWARHKTKRSIRLWTTRVLESQRFRFAWLGVTAGRIGCDTIFNVNTLSV
jgi:hypothetical protein